MSEFKVEGLAELSRKLSALGAVAGPKILRQSLMAAATPVVKEFKNALPVADKEYKTYSGSRTKTGRLVAPGFAKRNVAKRSSLSRDKTTAYVSIGVRREAAHVLNFLEIGTKFIQKKPILTNSLENNQKKVVDTFADRMRTKILKVAKS